MRYAAGEIHARHGHGFPTVSIVLAGAVSEDVGGTRVTAGPLQTVIKPAGTLHANRYGEGGALLLQVSPSRELVAQAADAGCPLSRWSWQEPGSAKAWVDLARAIVGDSAADAVDDAVAQAVAVTSPLLRQASGPPRWLVAVKERILDEPEGEVSLTELADGQGVHRVHLSRAFRRHFGITPSRFRAWVRLRSAAEGVATESGAARPLAACAYAAGFADQSHMTREFRRWLGATPGQYRKLARTR